MRGCSHTETVRRLRLDAVYAIGDRLRAEYEGMAPPDVPPALRALVARLDRQSGRSESGGLRRHRHRYGDSRESAFASRSGALPLLLMITLTAAVLTTGATIANAQYSPRMVPEGWTEIPTPREPGRRFVSPDGDSWLVARPARAGRSVQNAMDAIAYRRGERITYQRRGRSWIAVSGFRGDRIFYRKSNLACHGTEWHHIEMEYPAADKRRMDATVTRIARGMTAFNEDCAFARRGAG